MLSLPLTPQFALHDFLQAHSITRSRVPTNRSDILIVRPSWQIRASTLASMACASNRRWVSTGQEANLRRHRHRRRVHGRRRSQQVYYCKLRPFACAAEHHAAQCWAVGKWPKGTRQCCTCALPNTHRGQALQTHKSTSPTCVAAPCHWVCSPSALGHRLHRCCGEVFLACTASARPRDHTVVQLAAKEGIYRLV